MPFVFRGGGWSENLFLHYSAADTANQIALIKNLGLNGIRTEGKQMPADFYEQMDRAGILVDAGLPVLRRVAAARQRQGRHRARLRGAGQLGADHRPAACATTRACSTSAGRDNHPIPRQEAVSIAAFRRADFQEPLIASAEYKSATGLGAVGREGGPVRLGAALLLVRHHPLRQGRQHAYQRRRRLGVRFSEAGNGATIPTLDSIDRFLSPFEQTQLWKSPNYNQYHLNYEPDLPGPSNGGYSFGTLHDLDRR